MVDFLQLCSQMLSLFRVRVHAEHTHQLHVSFAAYIISQLYNTATEDRLRFHVPQDTQVIRGVRHSPAGKKFQADLNNCSAPTKNRWLMSNDGHSTGIRVTCKAASLVVPGTVSIPRDKACIAWCCSKTRPLNWLSSKLGGEIQPQVFKFSLQSLAQIISWPCIKAPCTFLHEREWCW